MSRIHLSAVVCATAALLVLPTTAWAAPGDLARADHDQVGQSPFGIATGDFDGDGNVDAATPNGNASSVSVLLGNGDGTFGEAPQSPIAVGNSPLSLVAGQLNGSGGTDLAVLQATAGTVRILAGDGDGTFTALPTEPSVGASSRSMAAGDLNGDGFVDLAVTIQNGTENPGSIVILLGNGTGGFSAPGTSPEAAGITPDGLAIEDLNGGSRDIAVANSFSDNVSVLLGAGAGDFTAAASPAAGDGANGIVAARLDGDADADLAVSNAFSDNTTILLNDGAAAFAAPVTSPEPEGGNSGIAAGDLDGDGDADLVTPQDTDELAVLLNNGSADFSAAPGTPIFVPVFPTRVAVIDTDNDSDRDVLVAGGNGGDHRLVSFLNNVADGDADQVADSADQCPSVAAPDGCPVVNRTVSAEYKRRAQAFKGVVASAEQTCIGPREKVRLFKNDRLLAKDRTNADGEFKLERRARPGTYTVRVLESVDPDVGRCVPAVTSVVVD